ncbi:MAG: formylglycine-generating enzyme family protein [Thiocapsa sp.]|nr:formylglycine-generating enzyme family protein [Thiocapsa sp.]MCG6984265.1 formylglycine-generating enzyme family protein [Thiocapsa sp.]
MRAGVLPRLKAARAGEAPADSVNWWDAMAFCHWLGLRLGFEVRLPTEFEWQCAALGADPRPGEPKRFYPWGAGRTRSPGATPSPAYPSGPLRGPIHPTVFIPS